jgi:PAS domain-containing protein
MEAIATLLALLAGIMALVLFNYTKTGLYFIIGAVFLSAGLLDGYHAIASSPLFADFLLSTFPSLILWSGIASSLILSVSLWLSSPSWKREESIGKQGRISGYMIYLTAGLLTLAGFLFLAFFLPSPAYYPKIVIERPQGFVPAFFFLLALVGYLRKGYWRHDVFEHWLVLFLIVGFASQAMFMSFSRHLFDEMSAAGHLLKMASYFFVFTGLVFSMYHLFRRAEEMNEEMARANQTLQGEVAQRDRAYKALGKAHDAAEIWILERTSEIAQTNKMLESEIAERERAEAALRESEERFRKIFDEGPLGMAIVDLDYRFVTVNSALCRMVGYSEQGLTGLTIAEITHPEDIKRMGNLPISASRYHVLTSKSGGLRKMEGLSGSPSQLPSSVMKTANPCMVWR